MKTYKIKFTEDGGTRIILYTNGAIDDIWEVGPGRPVTLRTYIKDAKVKGYVRDHTS